MVRVCFSVCVWCKVCVDTTLVRNLLRNFLCNLSITGTDFFFYKTQIMFGHRSRKGTKRRRLVFHAHVLQVSANSTSAAWATWPSPLMHKPPWQHVVVSWTVEQRVIRCWGMAAPWGEREVADIINFPGALAPQLQNLFLSFSIRFKDLPPLAVCGSARGGLQPYLQPHLICSLSLQPDCGKISSAPLVSSWFFFSEDRKGAQCKPGLSLYHGLDRHVFLKVSCSCGGEAKDQTCLV